MQQDQLLYYFLLITIFSEGWRKEKQNFVRLLVGTRQRKIGLPRSLFLHLRRFLDTFISGEPDG
jgi:hypothetical protein